MSPPSTFRSTPLDSLGVSPILPARMVHAVFHVSGLSCFADAVRLERRLRKVPGVGAAVVNPVTEHIYLTFDPQSLPDSDIIKSIERLGFDARRTDKR